MSDPAIGPPTDSAGPCPFCGEPIDNAPDAVHGCDPPFICPTCHAVAKYVRGEWETIHDDDCEWFHGPDEPPSVIPASVRAMADDPQAPTAPLNDFIEAMRYDDNWWWRIGCGHHLNLFEAALDRADDE